MKTISRSVCLPYGRSRPCPTRTTRADWCWLWHLFSLSVCHVLVGGGVLVVQRFVSNCVKKAHLLVAQKRGESNQN